MAMECLTMHSFELVEASSGRRVNRATLNGLAQYCTSLMQERSADDGATLSLAIRDRFLLAQWVLAGWLAGYTVNPINPELTAPEFNNILVMADSRLLVTDRHDLQLATCPVVFVDRTPTFLAAENSASLGIELSQLKGGLLIFTSGTTGTPKGVLLTCEQLLNNAQTAVLAFGLQREWTTGSILPLFHTFTLVSDVLTMWLTGGTCVICDSFSAATMASIGAAFQRYDVSSYSGVPIIFRMLSRFGNPEQFASLRFAIAGAAPLFEDTRISYPRLGHDILPCYGLSEACCFVTITPPGEVVPGTVGKPANLELVVLGEDDNGKLVPVTAGERGEICIRGASVITDGYWKRPDTRVDAFHNGYFRTGDIGFVDAAGYVHVTGRRKNMLIKGGEKFYLEDFDRALSGLDGLRDTACIVTRCDESDDEYTCCVVSEQVLDEALMAHIRQHLVGIFGTRAAPSHIVAIDEVPRTPTGKTQLDRLRKQVSELA